MPRIHAELLNQTVASIFQAIGAPAHHARLVSDHLVESNLAGHASHGVLRVPQYLDAVSQGLVVLGVEPEVVRDVPSGAVVDGQRGFGQVAAHRGMELAIGKARGSGVAAVGVRNGYHSGRLGSYTLMAAAQGMIGLGFVNAGGGGQGVVPFGGLARRLSTNPISLAAPSDAGFPLLLDMATSVVAEGKLRYHIRQGREVPPGWIINAQGEPTTRPEDFYGPPPGALLPLGGAAGYKGYALAFMIDVLAGALAGAGCCGPEVVPPRDGLLLVAFDVQAFAPRDEFYRQVSRLVSYVKSCPVAPGHDAVYVPGEVEHLRVQEACRHGIDVDETTWSELVRIARDLDIHVPPDSRPFA